MSRIVFVAGLKDSGSDTILDMVLEGSRKRLRKHVRLGFSEDELRKLKGMLADDAKKGMLAINKKMAKRITTAVKSGNNVVIQSPLTLRTEDGYLPLFPKEFFESYMPDVFVLFENTKTKSSDSIDCIDWTQQEINRAYAAMYASLGNTILKVIPVRKGNIKDSIKHCTMVVESFLRK